MGDGPLIKNTPSTIAAEKIAAATRLPAVSPAAEAKLPTAEASPFSLMREINDAAAKLVKRSPVSEFTPEDIANLEKIRHLLSPEKFGGKDGRFGHDDVRAVALALLETREVKSNIEAEVLAEFNRQAGPRINYRRNGHGRGRWEVGKNKATEIAQNHLNENWSKYIQKGRDVAFTKIVDGLTAGLEMAGQPKPAGAVVPDTTSRNITMADAEAFKAATAAASAKQRAISEKYPEFPTPDPAKVTQESLTKLINQIRAGAKLVNGSNK